MTKFVSILPGIREARYVTLQVYLMSNFRQLIKRRRIWRLRLRQTVQLITKYCQWYTYGFPSSSCRTYVLNAINNRWIQRIEIIIAFFYVKN